MVVSFVGYFQKRYTIVIATTACHEEILQPADGETPAVAGKPKSAKPKLAKLFAEENRGLLLDIFVFVANIFLMRLLTSVFIDLFSQVDEQNPLAKLLLGLAFLAMWILPAVGAVLKRWHFHHRLKSQGKDSFRDKAVGMFVQSLVLFLPQPGHNLGSLNQPRRFLLRQSILNSGAVFVPS